MKVSSDCVFGLAFINGKEILRDFEESNDNGALKMMLEALCRTEGEVTEGKLCWRLLKYF